MEWAGGLYDSSRQTGSERGDVAALSIREPEIRFDASEGLLDDKQLTLAFQRGDEDAYRAIYESYHRSVYGVCWRMLGHREDAQEATQETFLRVYQALGRFNGRYQLGPWIVRIATNVCLDHLRGRTRKPVGLTPVDELEREPQTVDDGPEELYLRSVEGRRIRRTLASLPSTHRVAIVLRDFQGLSYKDIALALDISETQVKALIHRARKGFKKSWNSAPLAALWPAAMLHRVADRLRRPVFVRGGAADIVTSSGGATGAATAVNPAVANGMIQNLAQVVTERFAPAVTAAVIGTGAMAGAPAIVGGVQATVMAESIAASISAGASAVASAADDLEAIVASGDALTTTNEGGVPQATAGDDLAPQEVSTTVAPNVQVSVVAPPDPVPVTNDPFVATAPSADGPVTTGEPLPEAPTTETESPPAEDVVDPVDDVTLEEPPGDTVGEEPVSTDPGDGVDVDPQPSDSGGSIDPGTGAPDEIDPGATDPDAPADTVEEGTETGDLDVDEAVDGLAGDGEVAGVAAEPLSATLTSE
jgi:RNA polymerase sigma factor (sigma-70 family)